MPKGKAVTDEEIDYILEHYQLMDTATIAKVLGRSSGSIRALYSRELRKQEEALYSEDY